MTNSEPIQFDVTRAFARVQKSASSQREQAKAKLMEQVLEKAKTDDQFRQAFRDNPREAIDREANKLTDESGKPVLVATEDYEEAIKKVNNVVYSEAWRDLKMEDVQEMIFGTIKDIRKSFRLTLILSQVLFYSGLTMVVVAFVVALVSGEKMVSLLFGAGGVGSVLISSLVTSPLNRVQSAAGDLVQLQMAYMAYYRLLILFGKESNLITVNDTILYARELNEATVTLIQSIEENIEKNNKVRKNKKPKTAPDADATPDKTPE